MILSPFDYFLNYDEKNTPSMRLLAVDGMASSSASGYQIVEIP